MWILLSILLGLPLSVLLVLWIAYGKDPRTLWKREILQEYHAWNNILVQAEADAARAGAWDEAPLRQKYQEQHRRGILVETLIRYPGVGPATIGRLKEAGLHQLEAASRADLAALPGIGPVRAQDLRFALVQARKEAESQFDAGACPAGVAFRSELSARQAEREKMIELANQVTRQARAHLESLDEVAGIARSWTFWKFATRQSVPELAEEDRRRPRLPILLEEPPRAEVAPPAAVAAIVARAESTPEDRLRAVAGLGFAIARYDGRIAAGERRQIQAYLQRRFPEPVQPLPRFLQEVEGRIPTLEAAIESVRLHCPPETWPELVRFAEAVADASGERNAREAECLDRISRSLRMETPSRADAGVKTNAEVEDWNEAVCREVLEINDRSELDANLVRRQFHILSERFDPDKFLLHGPEFIALAEKKKGRVERAAQTLLATLGAPLEAPPPEVPADLRHNPDLDAVFG